MSPTTIPRPPVTADWLDLRRGYFTASAAACLFHEHPFMTLADVAVTKLVETRQQENAATDRGHRLEDAVALWWSDEHGLAVIEPDVLHVFGRMLATLDRLVVGTNDALEVKTTRKVVDRPERYWWWQAQAQMHCARLDKVHLAVLDGTMTLKSFTVEPDPDAMHELAMRAELFMDCIEDGRMPGTPSYRNAGDLYPLDAPDRVVTLDEDTAIDVAELARVRARLRDLGKEEDELKARIGMVLEDAAAGWYEDREIVTWKTVTTRRLDQSALRRAHPALVAEFTVPTTTRVMRAL